MADQQWRNRILKWLYDNRSGSGRAPRPSDFSNEIDEKEISRHVRDLESDNLVDAEFVVNFDNPEGDVLSARITDKGIRRFE